MCAYYGPGIRDIAFDKKHRECQSVGKPPYKEHTFPFALWKILMKEEEIISEIQICLLWVSLR